MTIPTAPAPDASERRRNPLTGEWVLVAAGRDRRPWHGQNEPVPEPPTLRYDPSCYLCPGNERANGTRNPNYDSTFVFTNDFAALQPDTADGAQSDTHDLFTAQPVRGTCRVICFSDRHDLSLSQMSDRQVRGVVDAWCAQHAELSREWHWVQVFENRGAAMGASNPHPHGQIWASSQIPTIVSTEDHHQREYFDRHGAALLTDYALHEQEAGDRLVLDDQDWVAIVPFWATWPFETLLLPRSNASRFSDLSDQDKTTLAGVLGDLLAGYDTLFERPFPYSMGWHPAPQRTNAEHWVLHAHFYPPLLRADARKFLVGYELMAEAQRDLTPEEAASRLRAAIETARHDGRRSPPAGGQAVSLC